jgi:hypothetical protein
MCNRKVGRFINWVVRRCNVKFKGAITEGIRINVQPVDKKTKPEFTESNFEAA